MYGWDIYVKFQREPLKLHTKYRTRLYIERYDFYIKLIF